MVQDTPCRSITRNGQRCKRKATTAGFCGTHLPKPTRLEIVEKLKTAGQVVTTATGVITLIEKVIELWQSIPFGPGPTMPDQYHYLVDEFGPKYPRLAKRFSPGTYGAKSIDWSMAVDVYEFAKSFSTSEPDGAERQSQTVEILNVMAGRFIDEMQPDLRSMLIDQLAEEAEDDGDA